MKILLFDDHRIFGESLSKLLEDWDAISICDKLGAKNAIEAYNKAIALGYITPLI